MVTKCQHLQLDGRQQQQGKGKISILTEEGCTRKWPFKLRINVPLDLLGVFSKIKISFSCEVEDAFSLF